MTTTPRLRVMAKARPGALPLPAEKNISALTKSSVLDKWGDEAAGVRAVDRGDNVITMFDIIGEDEVRQDMCWDLQRTMKKRGARPRR